MTIDRNNYELIFLLAVDNELSAPERNMLNNFLNNNTDLQKEFNLLQNSIVPAEKIVFKGKINLLKPELISPELEEKILLFIDHELDEEAASRFQLEAASNEKLSDAINIFQQTKLTTESEIIFANKQLLYRKEDNKVIPFGWLKYAAAAVFIGFGVWGAIKYLPLSSNVTVKELSEKTSIPKKLNNGNDAGSVTQITPTTKVSTTINIKEEQEESDVKKNKNQTAGTVQKQPNLRVNENFVIEDKNSKTNNHLPEINTVKTIEISVLDKARTINTINDDSNTEKIKLNDPQNNVYATSFSEKNVENKVDHYSFAEQEDEPKKSRLSGFLRKAKRVLERNTKMNASNENLKVANFEFATQ